MNKIKLCLLALICVQTNTSNAEPNSTIKQRLCHIVATKAVNSFDNTMNLWFLGNDSEHNINKRFADLLSIHETHMNNIIAFAKKPLPESIQTPEQLNSELGKANTAYFTFVSQSKPLLAQDDNFLEALNRIENKIALDLQNLNKSFEGCEQTTKDKLTNLQSKLTELQKSLAIMRAAIVTTQRKRLSLLNISFLWSKQEIEKKYQNATLLALDDLSNQINLIFYAGELLFEVEQFKFYDTHVVPCYSNLQFQECLTAMESKFPKGLKIRDKIIAAHLAPAQEEIILGNLDGYIAAFKRQRDEVLSNGAARFFRTQTEIIEDEILAYKEEYGPQCLQKATEFQLLGKQEVSAELYKSAAEQFSFINRNCLAKSNNGGTK